VMEVVSSGDPGRDRDTKRREYAAAGIPEYSGQSHLNPLDISGLCGVVDGTSQVWRVVD